MELKLERRLLEADASALAGCASVQWDTDTSRSMILCMYTGERQRAKGEI
jgi:hypothetical protein